MHRLFPLLLTGCSLPALLAQPGPLQTINPPVAASRPCAPSPLPDRIRFGIVDAIEPARMIGAVDVTIFAIGTETIAQINALKNWMRR